jgi:hypothetical protein
MTTQLRRQVGVGASVALLATLWAAAAQARPCECDRDLDDIHRVRAEVAAMIDAWREILAAFDTDNAPKDWDDAVSRFQKRVWGDQKVTKVGGLDENGDPIINPGYEQKHCDLVVGALRAHERDHARYLDEELASNPFSGFINWAHAKLSPQWWARVMTQSEIEAHKVWLDSLTSEGSRFENENCDTEAWKCRTTDQLFQSKNECLGDCHANLGTFESPCESVNKWTGKEASPP